MNLRMARKRTETATELSKEIKARGKSTRVKKCTMKKTSTTTNKFHESGKHNSEREEKKPPLKPSAESPSSQDQTPIHTENLPRPSKKMKLQLFPLDTHTCKGLEKDGFHPYLELTLSSRKKISSVLQHIHSKWGSSEIARGGDPALYPYDKSLLASSSHKWIAKSNITTTTTGDVYAAIGSPSLFRLRYGWSSETENKTDEPLPSPSTPETTCFQIEKPQNIIGNSENQVTDPPPHDGQIESTENNKINDGLTLLPWDYDGGLSIGGLLSEVSLKGKFGNPKTATTPWDDNLTNISLGGFFSESSLQRFIKHEPEDKNNQPSLSIGGYFSEASLQRIGLFPLEGEGRQEQQQLPLISDSLDAFFANRTEHQSRAFLPPPPTHSSILDAEDTCQPFSFRKRFTTTSEKVLGQVSEEAVEEKEQLKDESKSVKLGSSMVFNQDSKLSAIKWDESRGQFDLGVSSSSQKFSNGDSSISLGAFAKDLEEKIEPLEEKTKQ